jgi:hypothetical protein
MASTRSCRSVGTIWVKVALRVDAENAFNAVSRAEILENVCEKVLPATRFVHAIYGGQPYVVTGRTMLLSCQGTQQGDPLGMLVFPLAMHTLVLRVQSESESERILCVADLRSVPIPSSVVHAIPSTFLAVCDARTRSRKRSTTPNTLKQIAEPRRLVFIYDPVVPPC